jgi:hypothetical protein
MFGSPSGTEMCHITWDGIGPMACSAVQLAGDTHVDMYWQPTSTFSWLDVDFAFAAVLPCAYGTRLKSGAAIVTTITAALIDAVIVALGGGVLAVTAFDALIGAPLLPGVMCTEPPPPTPTFVDSDFILGTMIPSPGSFDKFMQAIRAGAWNLYCECIPATGGGPPPVDYPAPAPIVLPSGSTGAPLPLVCDDTDICTILNQLMRQLAAMNAQVSYIRRDVQLIQRQKVPFAYVLGGLHTGLVGAGTFVVQGVLGFAVQTTTMPAYLSSDMAPTQSWFKLGEVSWGTPDGWQARRIVTHNPHLFMDVDGDVTLFAYNFEPGVVANVQELVRES